MKPAQATVYTSIERDNRLRWHPVIEIRERGQWLRTIVSLQGYYDAREASHVAMQAAKRLERGAVSG